MFFQSPLQLGLARLLIKSNASAQIPELQSIAQLVQLTDPDLVLSDTSASKALPPKPVKGKGKGKGNVPSVRTPTRGSGWTATTSKPLPKWQGPVASREWRAEHSVRWQPIRQASRLEASVWKQISLGDGPVPVPTGMLDDLNRSFMTKARSEVTEDPVSRFAKRATVLRIFPRQQALQADILHAKLARCGVQHPGQLLWITNCQVQPDEADLEQLGVRVYVQRRLWLSVAGHTGSSGSFGLSGDVLEALLALVALVDDESLARILEGPAQAPSEAFLQTLVRSVPNVEVLREHVRAALHIVRFGDADSVELVLLSGLTAVRAILHSKSLPVLFQGILLAGNYINSFVSSGGALGITLESIAKFAQARCRNGAPQPNALCLVLQHLRAGHPDLLERIKKDLDYCRGVKGLDVRTLEEMIEGLASQVQFVKVLQEEAEQQGSAMPDALAAGRLREFLSVAGPKVARLNELLHDLDSATERLRGWFAEPPESSLVDMLNKLVQLRDALPNPPPTRASLRGPRKSLGTTRRGMDRRATAPAGLAADGTATDSSEVPQPLAGEPAGEPSSAPSDDFDLSLATLDSGPAPNWKAAVLQPLPANPQAGAADGAVATPAEADPGRIVTELEAVLASAQAANEGNRAATTLPSEAELQALAEAGARLADLLPDAASAEEPQANQETNFEAQLALLKSALAEVPLQPAHKVETIPMALSVLQTALKRVSLAREAKQVEEATFQAPLTELQSVLDTLPPWSDGMEAPVAAEAPRPPSPSHGAADPVAKLAEVAAQLARSAPPRQHDLGPQPCQDFDSHVASMQSMLASLAFAPVGVPGAEEAGVQEEHEPAQAINTMGSVMRRTASMESVSSNPTPESVLTPIPEDGFEAPLVALESLVARLSAESRPPTLQSPSAMTPARVSSESSEFDEFQAPVGDLESVLVLLRSRITPQF